MQEDHGVDWSWGRYCCNDSVKKYGQENMGIRHCAVGKSQSTARKSHHLSSQNKIFLDIETCKQLLPCKNSYGIRIHYLSRTFSILVFRFLNQISVDLLKSQMELEGLEEF